MTIQQRVERMFNPGGSTPVGTGFPLVPFASLPAASTVEGQVRRLTELPHVSLIALSGKWRPFGGRQVLAQRANNPVTIQNLAGEVSDTMGPFPGGLVRAGMQLAASVLLHHPGVGTASRIYRLLIGNSTPIPIMSSTTMIGYYLGNSSGVRQSARNYAEVNVSNDTTGTHQAGLATPSSFAIGAGPGGVYDLGVNFSLPWYAQVQMQSAAETAVNIATATWAGGVATYNTSAVHTLAVGDKTTIAGVALAGYNGVVIVASIVDTDTFTVAMASDPGGSGTGGTSSRISNMISQSYVLELVG